MADNRLRIKAMKNAWSGMGWYTGDTEDFIEPSPEANEVSKHQKPNRRRKTVIVGKAVYRKPGM